MRQNMRDARLLSHMTAEEAAERIGVHQNALLRWERGESDPKGSNLIALSRLYQRSPEFLMKSSEASAQTASK